MAFQFNGIPDWLKPRIPLEELKVEASLFLVFDPGDLANYHYFLETRIIHCGRSPVFIQAVVCETHGEGPFTGTRKSYPAAGKGEPGCLLAKKGDILHENFELEISSASQFASAKPLIAVWTRSGRCFTAEVDRENIERIVKFEAERVSLAKDAARALGKAPILVVDDHQPDSLLIAKALEANDVENPVMIISGGEELLDYLHHQGPFSEVASAPCFILLDLNMPRINGHEALRAIKADPELREIPIIVMSGSRTEEDIEKSYEEGAASYLAKPSSFESLVETMGALNAYWQKTARLPLWKGFQN